MDENAHEQEHEHGHSGTTHEIVGHPRRTGRFWFDFVAASAAIFISVVSLVVAIRGESTQRELLAANSWPFLEASIFRFGTALPGDWRYRISIRNDGVGPAKVMTFQVFYDRVPVRSIAELLRRCCKLSDDRKTRDQQLPNGWDEGDVANNVIRAMDSREMLQVQGPHSSEVIGALNDAVGKVTFRACYCSILDRCWTSNLQTLDPTPTPSCPSGVHSFNALN